ncbi:unnamed protein product [Paramecium octaurelia]|uniref:Uncharacterized protein n=1 Tax=Paramecium octaurelia TaxID=43137 RepID=A0A8S1UKD8_PAROT|nr:unnamed protein product [Paramecium octaurelia]
MMIMAFVIKELACKSFSLIALVGLQIKLIATKVKIAQILLPQMEVVLKNVIRIKIIVCVEQMPMTFVASTYCLLQSKGVCMPECTSTDPRNCIALSDNSVCQDNLGTIFNATTGKCVTNCTENGSTDCFCGLITSNIDQKQICQSGFECKYVTTSQSECVEKCTTNKKQSCYCGQDKPSYCDEKQTCANPSQQIGGCTNNISEIQNVQYSKQFNLEYVQQLFFPSLYEINKIIIYIILQYLQFMLNFLQFLKHSYEYLIF